MWSHLSLKLQITINGNHYNLPKNKMNGMELDLAYLCKEVREIARASATFLKEERRSLTGT